MSVVSLHIVDASGSNNCSNCKKEDDCVTRDMLNSTTAELVAKSLDDMVHPQRMGWGPLTFICFGWEAKDA